MSKRKTNLILSIAYILINLFSVYLISVFEGKNIYYLILLLANILIFSVLSKKLNKTSLIIARTLIGALFIYSGFVKGVDPLGTQYRIEDYFYAFNMAWADKLAFALSLILNLAEFGLGILLLFNYRIRISSGLTTLMMIFFTFVTLNDAINEPVPDCGCFGDALIISNWQTFYKNLVINALLFPVFFNRFSLSKLHQNKLYITTVYGMLVLFIGFQVYNVQNLPVLDFRSWKIGNRLLPENPEPERYYVTYKNQETGETKEFLSEDLPWEDSLFMATYKFESSRIVDPNADKSHIIPMLDVESAEDVSKSVVNSSELTFIMVTYDIDKASDKALMEFAELAKQCVDKGYNFVLLSASVSEKVDKYINDNGLHNLNYYQSDDIDLKTIIRSNPGLILVKESVVINKYHHRNLKSFDEIITENN